MATSKARGNVVKLDCIINVLDPKYGAKGDSAGIGLGTDDRAAINAAVADAAGKTLYLPYSGSGGYRIGSNLTIPANVKIVRDNKAVFYPDGGAAVTYTGLIGQSLNFTVGDKTEHDATGILLNQAGSVFQITGGAGPQTISRLALYAAAQTGGGGSNDVEAANFVVQQNAADTATSMCALQLNINNNKADDVLSPAAAVSHYGMTIISGGSKVVGPAAIAISSSQVATNAFRRALQVAIGSITSDGYVIDYGGPGTGGQFYVNANGSVGIGTVPIANAAVAIGHISTILTGVNQFSVFEGSTASSAATGLFASFSATPATAAAAFTCPTVESFRANDANKGAGSAITTLIGFDCLNLTQGTNNYGFRGQVASGANKYNLYMDGTAQNYLAGNTMVNTSTNGAGSGTTFGLTVGSASAGAMIKTSAGVGTQAMSVWNDATAGDNTFMIFYTEGGTGTARGSITYNRGGGVTAYNTASDEETKFVCGPIEDPIERLMKLKPWRARMHGADYDIDTFVAGEFQEVIPEGVTGKRLAFDLFTGRRMLQQVDFTRAIPLLAAALQNHERRMIAAGLY